MISGVHQDISHINRIGAVKRLILPEGDIGVMDIAQVHFRPAHRDGGRLENRCFLNKAAVCLAFKAALHGDRLAGELGHHEAYGIPGTVDDLKAAAIHAGGINDGVVERGIGCLRQLADVDLGDQIGGLQAIDDPAGPGDLQRDGGRVQIGDHKLPHVEKRILPNQLDRNVAKRLGGFYGFHRDHIDPDGKRHQEGNDHPEESAVKQFSNYSHFDLL